MPRSTRTIAVLIQSFLLGVSGQRFTQAFSHHLKKIKVDLGTYLWQVCERCAVQNF